MTVKIEQYKKTYVITLNPDDKFPFRFGVKKAKLILEHLKDIEDFIKAYENTNNNTSG